MTTPESDNEVYALIADERLLYLRCAAAGGEGAPAGAAHEVTDCAPAGPDAEHWLALSGSWARTRRAVPLWVRLGAPVIVGVDQVAPSWVYRPLSLPTLAAVEAAAHHPHNERINAMTASHEVPFTEAHQEALREIGELTGLTGPSDVYQYTSVPDPTARTAKFVFQSWVSAAPGVQEQCSTYASASQNLHRLLAWCRTHPDQARQAAGADQ